MPQQAGPSGSRRGLGLFSGTARFPWTFRFTKTANFALRPGAGPMRQPCRVATSAQCVPRPPARKASPGRRIAADRLPRDSISTAARARSPTSCGAAASAAGSSKRPCPGPLPPPAPTMPRSCRSNAVRARDRWKQRRRCGRGQAQLVQAARAWRIFTRSKRGIAHSSDRPARPGPAPSDRRAARRG